MTYLLMLLMTVSSFIYDEAPFPSCHASTIVELQNGDLLAAWFGGQYEGSPDVCIWTSRKYYGASRWTTPAKAADGVFDLGTEQARLAGVDSAFMQSEWCKDGQPRKACYNPVLFQMPDGEVLLFFKIGAYVQDWTGWLVRSTDNGVSWSAREPLPEGFLGPIKNKPEIVGKKLLCPSSTEKDDWKIHFEAFELDANGHFPKAGDLAKRATKIGPIEAEQAEKTFEQGMLSPIGCIQPSILRLKDGRLQVLCRTQNGRLATSYSSDEGKTWSPVTLTSLPNNNSGTDAVTLRDGRQVLVSNPVATPPGENGGKRSPLTVSVSSDDGQTWQQWATLEDDNEGEYSYPAVIQGRDGTVHVTYTWHRERIGYAALPRVNNEGCE